MSDPMSVLVVEDHQVLGELLVMLIEREQGVGRVQLAGTAQEALRWARELAPKVALVDYRLPDATGDELIRRLRELDPELAVIVLTGESDEKVLVRCVDAGAIGFLSKVEAARKVTATVRQAAEGQVVLTVSQLGRVLERKRIDAREKEHREQAAGLLSPREREVLQLLAEGLNTREVSQRLHISFATVRGHVQLILEKLEAHSQDEALARAVQLGLVERRRSA